MTERIDRDVLGDYGLSQAAAIGELNRVIDRGERIADPHYRRRNQRIGKLHIIRVEAVDAKGNISAIQSCKIAVLK